MNISTAIEQLETSLHNEAAAFRAACAMGDVDLSLNHVCTAKLIYDRLLKYMKKSRVEKIWIEAFSEDYLPKENKGVNV